MRFFLFFQSPDQQLTEANKKEMKDAVEKLIHLSTANYGYYLFLTLSVLITTAGLLLKSSPVVIGGMIIAPLLTPLLACGLSILLLEVRGLMRAISILILSIIIALLLSYLTSFLAFLTAPSSYTIEQIPGIIPPGLYFLVAFCAGMAAAFGFVKEHLSSSMAGVAISASLLPPLCAIGVGMALDDPLLIYRSGIIFLLNIAGIILAGIISFWILGLRKVRHFHEKIIEEIENG